MNKKYSIYVGDFETTVYNGQDRTDVWASGVVKLNTEKAEIFHSIKDTYDYLKNLKTNIIIYYHNLKFDGHFWLDFLLNVEKLQQAYDEENQEFIIDKYMKNNTFKYSISDTGLWYYIIIKTPYAFIEIRDSLKLLPFSVSAISKNFSTKHKKLDMEYEGFRYPGCEITREEQEYLKNDLYVVKEALELMYKQGHTDLTIGSCCLNEYKRIISKEQYENLFPNLYEIKLEKEKYGSDNAGEWIRKSYKGGWCYLVEGKQNKVFKSGCTYDVNSLYPSMMISESGNRYPIGKPIFWKGNYIPNLSNNEYFFVRISTKFKLKKGFLPTIQIKNSFLYSSNVYLKESKIFDKKEGVAIDEPIVLTLTQTDYEVIKEHYILYDFNILDGCYFSTAIGLFDDYIEKYRKIKENSKGAVRTLAKLFLVNLYGKFSTSTDSSFKKAYIKDDGSVGFTPISKNDKLPGYIAIGSCITSYARRFTIKAAQSNFYGADKPGFIYADTDSIHCDLPANEIKGINVDDKKFLHWSKECEWEEGIFVRQKTYIEKVNGEYDVKCAGLPDHCKELFRIGLKQGGDKNIKKEDFSKEEIEFLYKDTKLIKRSLTDFRPGIKIPGKLSPKKIPGGVVLVETYYEMR